MRCQTAILASLAFLAVGGSAMAIATAEDLSSKDIVQTLDSITKKTAEAKDKAASLSSNVVTNAPALVEAVTDIVKKISKQATDINGSPGTKFNGTDKDNICSSLHSLVPGQKDFAEAIEGQKGVVSSTPFSGPIREVLRTLETSIDTLLFSINDISPDCKDFKDDKEDLDKALEKAVDAFN